MKKSELLQAINRLQLEPSDYIVIGSGVLGALGIREVDDVDIIVTPAVFAGLEAAGGWQRKPFDDGTYYLLKPPYEAGLDWDSPGAVPNLADLKLDELTIEGVPFVNLSRLRKWKIHKGTPKHLRDISAIDSYLKSKS